MYGMNFGFCFLLKIFKTVIAILWKSDIPVSMLTVFENFVDE